MNFKSAKYIFLGCVIGILFNIPIISVISISIIALFVTKNYKNFTVVKRNTYLNAKNAYEEELLKEDISVESEVSPTENKSNTKLEGIITLSIVVIIFSIVGYFLVKPLFIKEGVLPAQSKEFYVYDGADLLTQDVENLIVDVNKKYETTNEKPQIVVATVETLGKTTVERFALDLFAKWKIGSSDLDNGVLLLISEKERQVRIEVGYGLEGAITDSYSGSLLDTNIEYLKQDDYNSAVEQIFIGLSSRVNEEYAYPNNDMLGFEPIIKQAPPEGSMSKSDEKEFTIFVSVFVSALVILIGSNIYEKIKISKMTPEQRKEYAKKMRKKRRRSGGGSSGGGGASRGF